MDNPSIRAGLMAAALSRSQPQSGWQLPDNTQNRTVAEPSKRQQYSKEQWESMKPIIQQLYCIENKKFEKVVAVLKDVYGYNPTRKQFYRKIEEWHFAKKIKSHEMRAIVAGRNQVTNNEQNGAIVIRERLVDPAKILRWQKRQARIAGIGERISEVLGMNTPVHSGVDPIDEMSAVHVPDDWDLVNSQTDGGHQEVGRKQSPSSMSEAIDVTGSPTLSGLFMALKIECEYSEDIPPISLDHSMSSGHGMYISAVDFDDLYLPGRCLEVQEQQDSVALEASLVPFLAEDPASPTILDIESIEWLLEDVVYYPKLERPLSPFLTSQKSPACQSLVSRAPAISVAEHAKKARLLKKMLGVKDHRTLEAMTDLGDELLGRGRFRQAERVYRQVANINQETRGFQHLETLYSYLDVILALTEQGRYLQAQKMHQRVHPKIMSLVAEDHDLAMVSKRRLSCILWSLDEDEECEKVERDMVQITLMGSGLRDEATLDYIGRLAQTRAVNQRGSIPEILPSLRNAIQLQHEFGGPESTAKYYLIHDLAWLLELSERYEDAEALYNETARFDEIVLGPEHPRTMKEFSELARCLRKHGKLAESRSLAEQILRRQLKVFNETDDDVLRTVDVLACCSCDMGQYHEATPYLESLYQHAIEDYGPERKRTVDCCSLLGECYEKQDRHEDALALYYQARKRIIRKEGDKHPMVLHIDEWIEWHREQGRELVWQGDKPGSESPRRILEGVEETNRLFLMSMTFIECHKIA